MKLVKVNEDLSYLFRDVKQIRGATLEEISNGTGISAATYGAVLSGKREYISYETFLKFVDLAGLSLDKLDQASIQFKDGSMVTTDEGVYELARNYSVAINENVDFVRKVVKDLEDVAEPEAKNDAEDHISRVLPYKSTRPNLVLPERARHLDDAGWDLFLKLVNEALTKALNNSGSRIPVDADDIEDGVFVRYAW